MDNIDFDNRITIIILLRNRWIVQMCVPFLTIILFWILQNPILKLFSFSLNLSNFSNDWFFWRRLIIFFIIFFSLIMSLQIWNTMANILVSGKKKLSVSKYRKCLIEKSTSFIINRQELLNICLKLELKSFFVNFVCYVLCLFLNIVLLSPKTPIFLKLWPLFWMVYVLLIFLIPNSPCAYLYYSVYNAQSNKIDRFLMFTEREQKAIKKAKIILKSKLDLAQIKKLGKKNITN